jgi:sulfur transfer complex TusBCD TusB component (DsrH family)
MSVVLATAWYPRGELARFRRLYERILSIYDGVIVALHDRNYHDEMNALDERNIAFVLYEDFSGRHATIKAALEQTTATHIHYVDLDRALRWVETRPNELERTVQTIQSTDCLIIGRTERAYATHPRCLYETEMLFNAVFSQLFGREMDFGAGSTGLSQRAAEFLMEHSSSADALNMDVEWRILLKRAGFHWDYAAVDGLDWETADQFLDTAADADMQRRAADAYDTKAENWALRVQVAQRIMTAGLAAMERDMSEIISDAIR